MSSDTDEDLSALVLGASVSHIAVFEDLPLSVTALDGDGNQLPPPGLIWASSDPALAAVDADGLVRGVGLGPVTITATAGRISGSLELEVRGFLLGPDGGEAMSADGVAAVSVSPGALGGEVVISVEPADPDEVGAIASERLVDGTAYSFSPDGQTFAADVELSIGYDPADIPEGVTEASLVLSRAEAGVWQPVPGGTRDARGRKVKGKTRRFSLYAAAGAPPGSAPNPVITSPGDGSSFVQGSTITFVGAATDVEDGPLSGSALLWRSDVDGELGRGTSVSTDDLSLGTHTITLLAFDAHGNIGLARITIAITVAPANNPPTATVTAPASGASFAAGVSVAFAGTGTDPEDGALSGASLVWDSDLDGQIGTGTGFSTSALSVGTHTITLTATDSNGGMDTDQITVTITNNPPTATITAPASGSSFFALTPVAFAGTGADPEDGALTGASLVWTSDLDGQIGTGTGFSTSGLSIGTHTITLTATDSNGGMDTDQITVTIDNNPPVATITNPPNGSTFLVGIVITFDGTGTDPEDGVLTGASLQWSSDLDGLLGTGISLNLGILSIGTHTITLTATDSMGATGTDQITVLILINE